MPTWVLPMSGSYRNRRNGSEKTHKPRTPSPSSSHDSSEPELLGPEGGEHLLHGLKGGFLKKHARGGFFEWSKRFFEVDPSLDCLLYYRTFVDQQRRTPSRLFVLSELNHLHTDNTTRMASDSHHKHQIQLDFLVRRQPPADDHQITKSSSRGPPRAETCSIVFDCESREVKTRWVRALRWRIARQADAPLQMSHALQRIMVGTPHPNRAAPVEREAGDNAAHRHLGITCRNWDGSSIGAEVSAVVSADMGYDAGVRVGDVLIAVNGTALLSHSHAIKQLEAAFSARYEAASAATRRTPPALELLVRQPLPPSSSPPPLPPPEARGDGYIGGLALPLRPRDDAPASYTYSYTTNSRRRATDAYTDATATAWPLASAARLITPSEAGASSTSSFTYYSPVGGGAYRHSPTGKRVSRPAVAWMTKDEEADDEEATLPQHGRPPYGRPPPPQPPRPLPPPPHRSSEEEEKLGESDGKSDDAAFLSSALGVAETPPSRRAAWPSPPLSSHPHTHPRVHPHVPPSSDPPLEPRAARIGADGEPHRSGFGMSSTRGMRRTNKGGGEGGARTLREDPAPRPLPGTHPVRAAEEQPQQEEQQEEEEAECEAVLSAARTRERAERRGGFAAAAARDKGPSSIPRMLVADGIYADDNFVEDDWDD